MFGTVPPCLVPESLDKFLSNRKKWNGWKSCMTHPWLIHTRMGTKIDNDAYVLTSWNTKNIPTFQWLEMVQILSPQKNALYIRNKKQQNKMGKKNNPFTSKMVQGSQKNLFHHGTSPDPIPLACSCAKSSSSPQSSLWRWLATKISEVTKKKCRKRLWKIDCFTTILPDFTSWKLYQPNKIGVTNFG